MPSLHRQERLEGTILPPLSEFSSAPPDRGAAWHRLRLTKVQLAALTGVSYRQVEYWTRQGYLVAAETGPERYNGTAVDTCMLMKQALVRGLTARESASRARTFLVNHARQQAGVGALGPASREQLRDGLRTIQASLAAALQATEVLGPHEAPSDTHDD